MKLHKSLKYAVALLALTSFNFSAFAFNSSNHQSYAGTYKMNLFSDRTLIVSLENSNLMLESVGQAKFPLKHKSDHQYTIKGLPISVTFMSDKSGQFNNIEFNQQGKVIPFVRKETLQVQYKKVAYEVRTNGLSDAILMDDYKAAKALLRSGINVSELDTRKFLGGKNGRRPLNWASQKNNPKMIQLLVDSGADVNQTNLSGFTPLHHAAESNSIESIKLLLKLGANPQLKNKNNQTALEVAAINNNNEIVNLLQQ